MTTPNVTAPSMTAPNTVSRLAWLAAAVAGWVATAAVTVLQYRAAVSTVWFGVDIHPMKGAGQAVLAGRNVYDVHNFVYPPTAGVLSVPIAHVETHLLDRATLIVMIVAVLAVAALSVRLFAPPRPWRPLAAAVFAGVVMGGNTSNHALSLDNVSVLLAPFALAVIWLFGRGRWWTGCVVLEVSLLLKPLLAGVVLVPLLARRWLPLLVTGVGSAALLGASLQLGGGVDRAQQVLTRLLHGSIMVGFRAVGNLSLSGFASVHHIGWRALVAAQLVVAAAAVGACLAALRFTAWDVAEVAWVATVLVTAVYLAGSLSEVHYLFTLIPGAVAVLFRAPSRAARGLAVIALVAFCMPLWWVGNVGEQIASVIGEVTLFAGAVLAVLVASWRARREDSRSPDPRPADEGHRTVASSL